MKKFVLFTATFFFAISISTMAMATTIEYTATDNGGGNYTLEFEVFNNTLSADIECFEISFGQTTDGLNFTNTDEFSNFSPDDSGLGSEPQPTDWFSYSFEPSAIDNPGLFNSELDTLGNPSATGIAAGSSLSGFTVSFDWTGVGSYDGLFFQIYDLATFDVIDTGYTQVPAGPGTDPIPEPGTMILLAVGLFGLGLLKKKSA